MLRYRMVLGFLEELVGREMKTIHMVGGGVQNQMLCQLTADACSREVIAGPVEATAIGNIVMQAIGTGELSSVVEARQLIKRDPDIRHYSPRPHHSWEDGYSRFKELSAS